MTICACSACPNETHLPDDVCGTTICLCDILCKKCWEHTPFDMDGNHVCPMHGPLSGEPAVLFGSSAHELQGESTTNEAAETTTTTTGLLTQFPKSDDTAEGSTGCYSLNTNGKKAHKKGVEDVPVPFDWLNQYQVMVEMLTLLSEHAAVRDKLTKYDAIMLGQLDGVLANAGPIVPDPGKTPMSKKHFEALAESIAGLDTSKKNRSAIAMTLLPILRTISDKFDPYRFMEAATK